MVACWRRHRYGLGQHSATLGFTMTIAFARTAALGVTLALVLAGCGVQQRLGFAKAAPEIELPFRSKLTKGETDREFSVKVEAAGADLDAVRESVRHPATGYCLLNFGGSDIAWDMDADGVWLGIPDEDGDLTYAGTCTAR